MNEDNLIRLPMGTYIAIARDQFGKPVGIIAWKDNELIVVRLDRVQIIAFRDALTEALEQED